MGIKIITSGADCEECGIETDFDVAQAEGDWEIVSCGNCGAEMSLHFDYISEAEAADQN